MDASSQQRSDYDTPSDHLATLAMRVHQKGFAEFCLPDRVSSQYGDADQRAFMESWDRLGQDRFMADRGSYRLRCHGRFHFDANGGRVTRLPNAPHFQERSHNHLNGGIARRFDPIEKAVANNGYFRAALTFGGALATSVTNVDRWKLEAHQFRILAQSGGGKPTPEGIHRDGVDFVLIALVNRRNVTGGETSIYDEGGQQIYSRAFTVPGEAIFLDDERVRHGVDPIFPNDSPGPSDRDALVVTYRRDLLPRSADQ